MKFYENGDGLTEPRGFFLLWDSLRCKGQEEMAKLDLGIIYSSKPCHAAAVFHHQRCKSGASTLLAKLDPRSRSHITMQLWRTVEMPMPAPVSKESWMRSKWAKKPPGTLKAQPQDRCLCAPRAELA